MPHVTPQDVHVNQALTNFSVAYRQELGLYVATKFAPIVPSNKQSNLYFQFNKGDLLRNVAKIRAVGAESEGTDVRLSQEGPFFCQTRAIHQDLDMDTIANADNPLNPKRAATRNVVQWLMTRLEIDWALAFFKAAVWSNDLTGVAAGAVPGTSFLRWSLDDSDPNIDIAVARRLVQQTTGRFPNKAVIAEDVWEVIKNHPQMIDRIKYTQRGNITRKTTDIVADLWELDEVIVASAVVNSAAEGAADSVDHIMSNGVLLGYVEPAPAIEVPTACYTFVWNNLFGAVQNEPGGMGMRMLDYPMIWKKIHRVEGEMPYDLKIICSDLGCFMDKVISA